MRDGWGAGVAEAEKICVILALENHGGLPCTGAEQAEVITKIGSSNLKATIDVGNYMAGGEEGHEGTAKAAAQVAYVHFKDNKWNADRSGFAACTVGEGDVDHARCMEILTDVGFDGFVALEYEGPDDERRGVQQSLAHMMTLMGKQARV